MWAKGGFLGKYLDILGEKFTFGLLNAIFKDAIIAKKRTEMKSGIIKMSHRIVPMAMAPFFPILAILGYILGTSRAFNKLLTPILADPGHHYSEFLKKIINRTMNIAEGDIKPKDRFTRAFVVSDRLIEAIKPEVLHEFSIDLSERMSKMDPDEEVPPYYIENELKMYLNTKYDVAPKIPIKE